MIKNTTQQYGWAAIFMHWIMAIAIIGLFALGWWMVELDYYSSWYRTAPDLHKSIGICLAALLIIRMLWKAFNPKVVSLESDPKLRLAGTIVHQLLLGLVLLIIISGYLISTADGRGIEVFSLFSIPSFGELFSEQSDIAGLVHEYLAYTLMLFVAMHAGAALKHHFVNKNQTLIRMIKRTK